MIDFQLTMTGQESVKNGLDDFAAKSKGTANDALRKMAEEIKDDIESTAPVDTGEYKESWVIVEVAENMVYIVNTADHARFVVFANSKMTGVASADDPARGILHDVRAIVRGNIRKHRAGFITRLKNKLF